MHLYLLLETINRNIDLIIVNEKLAKVNLSKQKGSIHIKKFIPRLNHEEIEILSRPIIHKKIETVIKTSQQRKVEDWMDW